MSGRDLAARLSAVGPDSVPAAEALDCLMTTVYQLVWGAT